MHVNLVELPKLESSFLSCEKDLETILRKLFIESRPYSNELKKMLIINTEDCLENPKYDDIVKDYSIADLIDNGYILTSPKLEMMEHEEVKSYIIISFDNFVPNAANPEFRDCMVYFDILCNTEQWNMGDYQARPLKIAGYIDGLLNNEKLSGIGTFQFAGCNENIISPEIAGYTLTFYAIHGTDDQLSDQ